jgi:hypothetical protein
LKNDEAGATRPRNDINTLENTRSKQEPTDLLDEIFEPETVADQSDYEVCPHCHRPSWSHVRWLIEFTARDERAEVEIEELLAHAENGSISERQRRLWRALLEPPTKGKRLVIAP